MYTSEREMKEILALMNQPWLEEPSHPFFCQYIHYTPDDWIPSLDDEIEDALIEERPNGR